MNDRRHALIERYRAGRDTLADAVAAHPEPAVGTRSGREVLIHVIGWDREAVTWLRSLPDDHVARYADREACEARFAERMACLTEDQLRSEYAASAEALVQVLAGLPDAAFADGGVAAEWADEWAGHALDHAAAFGDIGS